MGNGKEKGHCAQAKRMIKEDDRFIYEKMNKREVEWVVVKDDGADYYYGHDERRRKEGMRRLDRREEEEKAKVAEEKRGVL